MSQYPPGPLSTATRHRERISYDADEVHTVLDEALVCHVGFVADGLPVVLPFTHVRLGGTLYLHSSTGSRLVRLAGAEGLPVCLTVSIVDGLVLARSTAHHSMNFRSVVVRGRARSITDPRGRGRALAALVDRVAPGRAAATRPPNHRELAAVAVLGVDLVEVSLKRRSGPPSDDPDDLDLPPWAGVLPVRTVVGPPEPAPDLAPGTPVPSEFLTHRSG